MPRFAIFIVILFFLGGVAYSAEGSIPGDFLYSVKILVNENIEKAVAVTDKSRAELEATLASHRLLEIEKLAARNKLTTGTLKELHARFDENIKKFKEITLKIEARDATGVTEIRSDLEVTLTLHRDLFAKIQDIKNSEGIEKMLVEISEERQVISETRMKLEEKEFDERNAKASAESALISAQTKVDEVQKYLESKKGIKDRNLLVEANERLKAAIGAIAEGKAKLEVPAYADAFALFKKAEREALSVKLYMLTGEGE